MVKKWYPVSGLVGGFEGDLDAIDGSDLNLGDRAIAIVDDYVCFYIFEATILSGSLPNVVIPVSNANGNGWILRNILNVSTMYSEGDTSGVDLNIITGLANYAFGSGNIISTDNGGDSPNVICNGEENEIINYSWGHNFIGNGDGNKIYTSEMVFIGTGFENYIGVYDSENDYIDSSSILNGSGNRIIGSYIEGSTILDGYSNIIWNSNYAAILAGNYNELLQDNAVIIGGNKGLVTLNGQEVFANGRFSSNYGISQRSTVLLNAATYDSDPTEMFLYEDEFSIALKMEKFCQFEISLAAHQIDGTAGTVGDAAFWKITGGIKNVGALEAIGKITFAGVPVDEETFTINETTYTWKDTPVDNFDIEIGSTYSNCAYAAMDKINLTHPDIYSMYYSSGVVSLMAFPNSGSAPNSWTFTESCTNITMDGSGLFGGFVSGSDGTVSFVGTPQGSGVPQSTDRDAAAATWSVSVTADDTDKILKIEVTGEEDKEINWVAKVNFVEVG